MPLPTISATPSSARSRIGPAPVDPPADEAAPSRGVEWRETAKTAAVIVVTQVLLAAAAAIGVRALGR